jgi:hypothetical protein
MNEDEVGRTCSTRGLRIEFKMFIKCEAYIKVKLPLGLNWAPKHADVGEVMLQALWVSALEGVYNSNSRPSALPAEKEPRYSCTLNTRLGVPEAVWTRDGEMSALAGNGIFVPLSSALRSHYWVHGRAILVRRTSTVWGSEKMKMKKVSPGGFLWRRETLTILHKRLSFRSHLKRRNCHAFNSIPYHGDSHFPVGWFLAHPWTLTST